tara:strand:- start:102 stop:332 length:231 start_codon:yes stop_codon:yes gene_type:complete
MNKTEKEILKMRDEYEILYGRLIDVWNDIQELDDEQNKLIDELIELKGEGYFEEFIETLTTSAPNYKEAYDRNFIP